MYTEEALREAFKDVMEQFAALGANPDNFPTIEEFRVAFEEDLKENPPYDDEDDYIEGEDKPTKH